LSDADDVVDPRGAFPDAGDRVRLNPPLVEACERALAIILRLEGPADATLREFFRNEPRLGRRDRGVVAETVFDVLRHRRRYANLAQSMQGPLPRRIAWLSLVLRFGESAFGAMRALTPDDRHTLERLRDVETSTLPQPVRLSLPDWLYDTLLEQCRQEVGVAAAEAGAAGETGTDRADGADGPAGSGGADTAEARLERLGQVLLEPAPIDLRVNLLKADRDAVLRELASAGIAAQPLAEPLTAVRIEGRPPLERMDAFEQGWFEVQDAGSQRLVDFAAPRRGQTVVDFCAGAGGKTLALAAAMRSTGQIYACDVSPARLQRMKPRLARSGASNVQPFGIDSERDPKLKRLRGRVDLVLVDAPCSGTGTLRRNPELKWRMQPEALDELGVRQRAILDAASALVKPGGTLVYATCSLLVRENETVVEAFSAAHPAFGRPELLHIRPDRDGCDGFFAARWQLPKPRTGA
jgi:16S rRNA (cytosine967-C5)-methyltransferase